ncbi:MAG: hypothetical protein GY795_29085 [Desulfobacterales bacterium]|nr:hypothetical protein [Desulfobacterales bacterium]
MKFWPAAKAGGAKPEHAVQSCISYMKAPPAQVSLRSPSPQAKISFRHSFLSYKRP